jgi:hypothetical protein
MKSSFFGSTVPVSFGKMAKSAAVLVALASSCMGQTDTWNYDKNGTDWNIDSCNDTTVVQSPINYVGPGVDWYSPALATL